MSLADLLAVGAATLGESGGSPMDPRIRPVWPDAQVAGPAFSVACGTGDNLAVHAAVAEAPPGSVLCVSFESPAARGYWGEVLTTGAQARGIIGLVIDGGVRDTEALERLRFPVFASGVVLRGAGKAASGSIGGWADVGEVRVHTGDLVVGDRDGVVVVPSARFSEVRAAALARVAKEDDMFQKLRDGATTVELLNLDTLGVRRGPWSSAQPTSRDGHSPR